MVFSSNLSSFFLPKFRRNLFHIYPRRNGWGTAKSAKYGYGRIYDDKKDFNVKVASFAEDNDVSARRG